MAASFILSRERTLAGDKKHPGICKSCGALSRYLPRLRLLEPGRGRAPVPGPVARIACPRGGALSAHVGKPVMGEIGTSERRDERRRRRRQSTLYNPHDPQPVPRNQPCRATLERRNFVPALGRGSKGAYWMATILEFLPDQAPLEPQDLAAMAAALDDILERLKLRDDGSARTFIATRIDLARTGDRQAERLRDRLPHEVNTAERTGLGVL